MARTTVYPVLPFDQLAPHIDASGDCWEWTGEVTANGYGILPVKIDGRWRNRRAHRLVRIALCGPIFGNLPLDHLCRIRHCVNPDHLEPVTTRANILRGAGLSAQNARKTHCKYGHSDWHLQPNGHRDCRPCRRAYDRMRTTRIAKRSGMRNRRPVVMSAGEGE